MERVISKDGIPIAYYRGGAGAPLVMVHGTGPTHARWASVLPLLESKFTVYAVDRRGRGESGDGDTYAMEREFEDIAAVVDSIGDPVNLLGHSYGGLCSLEAALLTRNLRRLILYEPPLPFPGKPIYPEGIIDRLQALLDAGDREGVVATFTREVVRMPPQEFELYKSLPAWSTRVASAHTLVREVRAHEQYTFDPQRFNAVQTPTLLLVGGDSPAFFKAAIEAMHGALPNSRIVTLPGQRHVAMDTAPELFARIVTEFLTEPDAAISDRSQRT